MIGKLANFFVRKWKTVLLLLLPDYETYKKCKQIHNSRIRIDAMHSPDIRPLARRAAMFRCQRQSLHRFRPET